MKEIKQTSKKKIYITKQRDKSLHMAISIDDHIYRRWERMVEDINERASLIHNRRRIVKVIKKNGNVNEILMIRDVVDTGEGFIVYV